MTNCLQFYIKVKPVLKYLLKCQIRFPYNKLILLAFFPTSRIKKYVDNYSIRLSHLEDEITPTTAAIEI